MTREWAQVLLICVVNASCAIGFHTWSVLHRRERDREQKAWFEEMKKFREDRKIK